MSHMSGRDMGVEICLTQKHIFCNDTILLFIILREITKYWKHNLLEYMYFSMVLNLYLGNNFSIEKNVYMQ